MVVGLTRAFTYDTVAEASSTVRGGARLIGTNTDATYPTPDGLVPGAGSILAAVATAAGATPEVAGKPHRPTADAITRLVPAGELRTMVGDRPDTDGALAGKLGVPFALVLSGVTRRGDVPEDATPAAVAPDLLGTRPPDPRRRLNKCLQPASTSDTLVQWQAMSAYASTSMRARSSDRSAVAGPRRSCESW